jgi:hypothetical protein
MPNYRILRAAGAASLGALIGAAAVSVHGQSSGDPSTLPLLQSSQLVYVGAFRVPSGTYGSTYGFSYSRGPIAYDAATGGLFLGGHPYAPTDVAEIAIPTPVNSADLTKLLFASVTQQFADVTEGHFDQLSGGATAYLGGLLVDGTTLYGTGYIFYDATSSQVVSHFARSTTLTTPSFRGFAALGGTPQAGYVSGWMTSVPTVWRQAVGGPALTGNCCLSIIGRTSLGPDAFAFDPSLIEAGATIPAIPLVYYSLADPTLGPWSGSNSVYGGTTQVGGMVAVTGTRTVLYFGRNGTGPFCYGEGTSNQSLAGQATSDGSVYCYDPSDSSKGQHAYPYNSQVWAYDLNDLVAVRNGQKQPWQVVPYATWTLSLPIADDSAQISSVAYDSAHQLIYLVQPGTDPDGGANRPLIQVLHVSVAAPPPPPYDAWAGTGSFSVGAARPLAVAATTTPANPAVGMAQTVTSTTDGGAGPLTFRFYRYDITPGTWTLMRDYAPGASLTWVPTAAGSSHFQVWVRNAGSVSPYDAWVNTQDFVVGSARPLSVTAFTRDVVNVAAGMTVHFTATTDGGQAPVQYRFWRYGGGVWTIVQDYGPSDTYTWQTATTDVGSYTMQVWVRSATSTASFDAWEGMPLYQVGAPRSLTVSLASDTSSPAVGITTTWTATTDGGQGSLAFAFYRYDQSSGLWTLTQPYGPSPSYTWTPGPGDLGTHLLQVWVLQQ